MTRPDVARIREALIAARDITAARDTRLGNARPQALRTPTDRRRLDGALTAGLAKAGIDVGQWEAELAIRRSSPSLAPSPDFVLARVSLPREP